MISARKRKMFSKRKKRKPKMKRLKKEPKMISARRKNNHKITHPWGGHLPHPPFDCDRKDKIFTHQGTRWIDIGICINCKEFPEGCPRKKQYVQEERDRLKEHFKNKKQMKG